MYCPRLDHFVRFNFDGTLSRCGHMVNPPGFQSLEDLDQSAWLINVRRAMSQDSWPSECVRCHDAEAMDMPSVRNHSLTDHAIFFQQQSDYLVLGGVLDNVCNSACQTCNEQHSTKIGSLTTKNYIKINNSQKLAQIPMNRVIKMDINGGEPSASPAYISLLENLPDSIQHLRLNTNGSRVLTGLPKLIDRGVKVTVTVSFDGIGLIHDYVRWPIKWKDFERNLMTYKDMNLHELNTWTTVSALNIGNLEQIQTYTARHNIKHSYALLEQPSVLSVKHSNHFTKTADVPDKLQNVVATQPDNTAALQLFTETQDQLRGIRLCDYYKDSWL